MQHTSTKMRSCFKCHGGKHYQARRIVGLMPEHTTYVEPFLGGGTVFLNKNSSLTEVISDLDSNLINAWYSIRSHPLSFISRLEELKYSPEQFDWSKGRIERGLDDTDMDRAVNFLVMNRMSRGGLGESFGWSERLRGKKRPGGPIPGDVNAWETMIEELPAIAERLAGAEIWNCEATEMIQERDSPETLFYLDPPYVPESRTAKVAYEHEMSFGDHCQLLDLIRECSGIVMISGYPSNLYDLKLREWTRHDKEMPNHSGQGKSKQRRTECVWINR